MALRRLCTRAPQDHYEVLGVPPDATPQQIRAAFLQRCKEVHPDGDPTDPSRHSRFQVLAEAYGVLGRPSTRIAYDRQRRSPPPPPGGPPPTWDSPPGTHGTDSRSGTHRRTPGFGPTERTDPNSRYWSQFRPPGAPPGTPQRRRVLLLCLLLAAGGAAAHALVYRYVAGAHSAFMDQRDQELRAAYERSRARAGSRQELSVATDQSAGLRGAGSGAEPTGSGA